MGTLTIQLRPFFEWLLRSTVQASVLICLILLIQILLAGKLGVRWRHAFWLVLLIRMVTPWAPQSRISIFNLIPQPVPFSRAEYAQVELMDETSRSAVTNDTRSVSITTEPQGTPKTPIETTTASKEEPSGLKPPFFDVANLLPAIWLAGVAVLAVYVCANNFALLRIVRRERLLTEQKILDLLEDCKAEMGIRTILGVVPTDKVKSASLFGFVRPRLLLPRGMIESLSRQELRYVFLHELAHLKRHDIYLGWLTSLLQVLHWFNPLVWLAFYRMRVDRELACDYLVLARLTSGGLACTQADESKNYGRTIVSLLERFSHPRRLPSMAGILETKSQLKRRITMIAQFKKNSYRWSPLAVALIIILGCVSLPDAKRMKASESATSKPAHQPNFRKLRIPNRIPYDAQLSPDGKSIALGLEEKLWIIPCISTLGPDVPGAPQLVNTGEIKVDPYGLAWSGDGQWIAFNEKELVRAEKREGNYRMYVVSVQRGKPKEVYDAYRDAPAHNRQMSLSPKGKTLAFSSVDANELHIYTISVEGGVPKRLVDAPAREPVFSPDGKLIAYVEDKLLGHRGGGLRVVPADGGTPRRVAEASNACSPVWSPDGRMIAFFDFEGDEGIYIVPIDEDGERAGEKITINYPKETGELYRLTGWTPDNKIGAIFRSPVESGLYTLPLKGGPATLVRHGGYPILPHWSPDGKRIIHSYYVGVKEARDGWVDLGTAWVPAEGGQITTIPIQADTNIVKAGWGAGNNVSPDGKTIVFAGRKVRETIDTMHIWTLPIEGGKPTQLTDAPVPLTDRFPCWSPDGKAIAFVRSRESENIGKMFTEADIFILPAAGGELRQLTSESDMVAFGSIAWSPDGKLLAYLSIDNEWSPAGNTLRVIPAEGEESRIVAKLRREFEVNIELAWSPDSRRIALNDPSIRIVSLDDGHVVDIDPHMSTTKIYHLDWSRDGEKLVFSGYQGGEVGFWLMENFLPAGQ